MRRVRKTGIALVLIMMLMQLFGCGKEPEEAVQTGQPEEEYVYVTEFQSLDMENLHLSQMLFGDDGTVYMAGALEGGSWNLYSMRIGDETPETLPFSIENGAAVSGMGKDAEGNLLLGLIRTTGAEGQADLVELKKVTTEGNELETVDATAALAKVKDLYFGDILTDSEGNYYASANESVYVLKATGELILEVKADAYISDMFALPDGRIVTACYGNTGWQIQEVSLSGKNLVPVESAIRFEYGTYTGGKDTDLLYTQDTTLYTANLKDEEPVRILDWVDSDISSNNLQDVIILEDGRIAALTMAWNSENSQSELAVLTKKKRSEVPEKKILTYGTLYLPYFTNQDIVAFNKQSDEYRIEIKQYGDDNTDMETKISLLTADITSGNGPDIIDMFYNYIPLEDYLNMGVLEDLNPYLEKDPELKKEDFVDSVIKAYEKDGKLYSIMSGFGVRTIAGKVSDVGTGKSWSVDDFIKLVESKPADIEILPYSSKSSILNLMCSLNINRFINQETGECNFAGEDFIKILEFANRFPKEMQYDPNGPSEIEKIRSGELLLLDTTVTSVQLFQMHEFMFGEEVNYIGYPTIGESGTIVTPFGTTVAMNAQSGNKEGVWEFIRFNLLEENQKNIQSYSSCFPILKSALEAKFEKEMEAEYYEDEDGNQKEMAKSVWGQGDFSVEVFSVTAEQVERVRELIDSVGNDQKSNAKINEIINEEALAYFEGQKSAQDAAALIQNRVQVYVNETR